MKWSMFLPYLAVTAGVTYLIRMLPLTVFRREIKSRFVRSFLAYIPYAVLGAMTFPDVFYSTGDLRTAVCGVAVAVLLAWRGRSLLTVAVAACCAVALSLCFHYIPGLNTVSSGFVIIICGVLAAALGAWRFPAEEDAA